MVTQSAPLMTIIALALEPLIVEETPLPGWMVIVLVALEPGLALITIGSVSEG